MDRRVWRATVHGVAQSDMSERLSTAQHTCQTQGLQATQKRVQGTESKAAPPGSRGFPESSVGEESACSAGDPSLIPGLGRSPGEWIGHPLQYSWASLVVQMVKNPPTMQETWV